MNESKLVVGIGPVTFDDTNTLTIRGTVTGEVRGPEALASINALSHKYSGTDYPGEIQSERVILQITPDRQRSQGF